MLPPQKVVVLYYLADDSVQVTEPKQDNSGIPQVRGMQHVLAHASAPPASGLQAQACMRVTFDHCTHRYLSTQGVFVKRHQITKEQGGSPFTPADLAVGETVTVYGRTFFVVDADAFTRAWYTEHMNLELAGPGTYPADPVDASRKHFGLDKAPSEQQGQRLCLIPALRGAWALSNGKLSAPANVRRNAPYAPLMRHGGSTMQCLKATFVCRMFACPNAAAKKSNDLATFVEARLGKPSHLLEGDKLKQFLAQVGRAV